MTKEFRYVSYLKLDSSVVTSCTKTDGKWKAVIFYDTYMIMLYMKKVNILSHSFQKGKPIAYICTGASQ